MFNDCAKLSKSPARQILITWLRCEIIVCPKRDLLIDISSVSDGKKGLTIQIISVEFYRDQRSVLYYKLIMFSANL